MATDWIALQALAAAEFGRRVAAVTDWDAPTPDSEWTTRDLVTHVIDEQRWIPLLLAGTTQTHDDHTHPDEPQTQPQPEPQTHPDQRQTHPDEPHTQSDEPHTQPDPQTQPSPRTPADPTPGTPTGDDLVGAWDHFATAATTAWQSAPQDTPVHLESDVVTAGEYLAEQTSDITIHTWDLARATGTDDTLPDALVEAVWQHFEPQIESLAATGLYAAPVEVGEDAPLQVRLLAVTGRDARVSA